MADREAVGETLWVALSQHGLEHCVDGVLDILDTVVEWDDDVDEEDTDE